MFVVAVAARVPPSEKPELAAVEGAPPNVNPEEAVCDPPKEKPVAAGAEVVTIPPRDNPPAGVVLAAIPPKEKPEAAADVVPRPKAGALAGAAPPREKFVGATAATVAIGVP